MISVGKIFRELRVAAGMTQRDIAASLSYSDGYLANAENDRRIPSEEFVERFLDCVNATPEGRERLLSAIAAHKQQEKTKRKQRWQEQMTASVALTRGAPVSVEADPPQTREEESLQQANIYLQAAWTNPETREAAMATLKALASVAQARTEETEN